MIEPLVERHDRKSFTCGNSALDEYLRTKARVERDKNFAAVFVLRTTAQPNQIAGYYTLSSWSIELGSIPERLRKRFPRYPTVPVTLLGRLARATEFHGRRVGSILLADALKRSMRAAEQVGSVAVVVDAIDDAARDFYMRHGFVTLEDAPNRLYLPMATIASLAVPGQTSTGS